MTTSINLYRYETYHSDKTRYSGPVSDSTTGWSFVPVRFREIPEPGSEGLISDQVLGSGSFPDAVILAPAGSRIHQTWSGSLALFLPGQSIGIGAANALTLAQCRQEGLEMAPEERR